MRFRRIPNFVILGIILLVGFLARLYHIDTPLGDWHSFRQADTASVAREFVKNGINLLEPKYHDLSNIQSGLDNPQGFRMVELPYISALVALTYPIVQSAIELHQFYRLTSILFSLISIFLIYKIAKRTDNEAVGLLSAAVFALLPYNIYYSRSILPEVPLVTFSLLGMYGFIRVVDTGKIRWLILFILSFALALLLKPIVAVLLLPLLVYAISKNGINALISPKIVFSILVIFLPLILWRQWILRYPAGIPDYDWLLNGNGIRFRPAFFHWIFAQRIPKLILGYWGLFFLISGYLYSQNSISLASPPSRKGVGRGGSSQSKAFNLSNIIESITKFFSRDRRGGRSYPSEQVSQFFYNSWTIALLIYLVVFAAGNVQHDYYQIILVPLISIMVAKGIAFILSFNNLTAYTITLIAVIFTLAFGWFEVRGFYNINNWEMIRAGRVADQILPKDALVVAPYQGDTAFLYQINRRGWPIGFDIAEKIDMGATHYISTTYDDEARELEQKHTLLEKTDEYIIIELK